MPKLEIVAHTEVRTINLLNGNGGEDEDAFEISKMNNKKK